MARLSLTLTISWIGGAMKVDIVVIGNIVKETILFPDKEVGPVLGSPCAYTSVALAKEGNRVGMVTHYGPDLPADMKGELHLVDDKGMIPYLYTTEDHLIYRNEERNFVEYYKAAPVIQYDVIPEEYLKASTFFICPMDFDVNAEVCEYLHNKGKKVVVDLGGYGGTTSYNHFSIKTNRGRKLLDDLCKHSWIVKASRDDLSYIMPGMSMEECAQYIISRGPEYVVITLGAQGAAYQEKEGIIQYIESYGDGNGKNVTGAGDVFVAGMLTALLEKQGDMRYAVQFGNCAAFLAMQESGGCKESRIPSKSMVEMWLKKEQLQ